MSRPVFLLTVGFFLASLTCSSKVILPAVFSDHMVLQRNSTVAVWGFSDPGENIRVCGSWSSGDTVRAKATNDGHWRVDIKTGDAGGPFELNVLGASQKVTLQDVLLGEVWICSGQSNMEFSANWGLENKQASIEQADFPGIRFFHVQRVVAPYPQQDTKGNWELCSPSTMQNNTAVGYFFARALQRKLNVPIGLIQSAWGGTPAETWIRADKVASNPDLATHPNGDQADWWPIKPGALYNGMIAPLIPYGIAGAIWYQGESNTNNPGTYAVLMDSLVTGWRRDFGWNFPFYYVQIAPFTYDSTKQKAYILREQQDLAQRLIPNTGMVVIGDLAGDIHDIHPKNKLDVGYRLAAYALAETYHQPMGPYQSPCYKSMRVVKDKAYLTIDRTDGGLVATGTVIPYFQVAGADQQFVAATAVINKQGILVVSANSVKEPVAVRYCFSNSAVPNIFSKNGHLPLAPFRTDNWKIE